MLKIILTPVAIFLLASGVIVFSTFLALLIFVLIGQVAKDYLSKEQE